MSEAEKYITSGYSGSQKNSQSAIRSMKILNSVQQNLQKQITGGKLIIAAQKKPFSITVRQSLDQNLIGQKIKSINGRKQKIQLELDQVVREQEDLMSSQIKEKKLEQSRAKYYKSDLSPQDAEHIKKLIKQSKKFERQLQQKSRRYEEKMKQFVEQEQQIRKQKQLDLKQKRKTELAKKLAVMQVRRKQQQQKFEQENKILRSAIEKKRAHNLMKDKWKQKQLEEQSEKQQIVDQLRRMKSIDFQEIKQHSRKYDETIKAQRQSRIQFTNPNNVQNYYSSTFLDLVLEQKENQKKQQQLKKLQLIQLIEKKKAYGEQVRTNYKPNTKPESSLSSLNPKESNNKSLSFFEAHKKGVEYLRSANNHVSQHRKQQNKQNVVDKQEVKKKYRNYLAQLKKDTSEKGTKSEVDQIRFIAQNSDLTDQEKLYKAKMLTDKIQSKPSNKNLVKSINAKLELLRQIQY